MPYGKRTKARQYTLIGALAGLVLGVLEAFVTSLEAPDLWDRMELHFLQFGFACPFLGGICGYVFAKRLERRFARRRAQGLCAKCGYNLTGNVSGVCPECGAMI